MDFHYFKNIILSLFIVETFSLLLFYFTDLYSFFYISIVIIFAFVTWQSLKYGVFIIFTELILGSKGGDLFMYSADRDFLSIRISLWVTLMLIWFFRYFLPKAIKDKNLIKEFNYPWFKYFGVFMLFVLWGVINALLRGNELTNIYADFNAYLYFLTIFPLLTLLNITIDKKRLMNEFIAFCFAIFAFISIKTILLLYLFSHNIEGLNSFIYAWVRDTGVGEITKMEGGFYRIFFQSHIYLALAIFPISFYFLKRFTKSAYNLKRYLRTKDERRILILLVLIITATVVSLSRSNWVGIIAGLLLVFSYYLFKKRFKDILTFSIAMPFLVILSILLILFTVKFPYPDPLGGFSTGKLLGDRVSKVSNEAGVSSRWNLLKPLGAEISEAPILGKGFGKTVTYISDDPRIRSENSGGEYTTYVFEWGWLDLWLETGLLGLLSYVLFLMSVIYRFTKECFATNNDNDIYFAVCISLIAISAIHFFSPYLNHPLGIGYVIFSIFFLELYKKHKTEEFIN